ncbi:unnamed protein product [Rhizophagus irregularis]|nr:unnamed protein product [Rhizophagus irregularis]
MLEINPNRLTIEELKKKLRDYGIDTDIMSDNRVVLAEILQNILNDETSKQVSDMLNTETIDTDLDSRQVSDYKLDFSLSSGWALKENQKFGKKGGGLVEEGILEEEEIPKVSTISNWIARYAQTHHKLKAQHALALVNRT